MWNTYYLKIIDNLLHRLEQLWRNAWVSCDLYLTHLSLDKMAAILADDNFKCIFSIENDRIIIQISQKLVPMSLIGNKPALVQVMAWCWTGNKPLPEPMLTQFTDT